jgi:DNA polymerase I-like protein with 3'-5' exonuclease and polymerase domains
MDSLPEMVNPRTHHVHPSFPDPAVIGRPPAAIESQNILSAPGGGFVALSPAVGSAPAEADYSQIELRILAHFR